MQVTIERQNIGQEADTGAKVATSRLWDMDVESGDREAIDQVLGHLIKSGTRPAITVTGDVIEIVTAVTQTMQKSVPTQLTHPLKTMMDYLARWLCDYVDETGATVLRVTLGFDALSKQREGDA